MADRYCKVGGSNLLDGTSLANAWETAFYTFTSVGISNRAKFSAVGGSTFDVDRPAIPSPIPSGSSGSPTIIADNGDGAITFNHPGSGWLGFVNFSAGSGKSYISFIGTAPRQLIFDGENQTAAGALFYLSNGIPSANSHITLQNCELRNCMFSAVLGGHTPNLTFDNCDIHDNGSHSTGTPLNPQDHGVYASGANLIIKNSRIYNNWGYGLQTYSSSGSNYSGREIYNNWIYNNGYGGGTEQAAGIIFSEGSGAIYNNLIFKNSGHGIDLWRTSNVTIYHNSLHQNTNYNLNIGNGGASANSGTIIKNNIALEGGVGDVRIRTNAANTILDWNRISEASILNQGSGTTSTNLGLNATDTVEWEAPTGATLASRDYNLKTGASSIAPTGIASVGVTTDIEGTARNFIDQGAYAYGSTTPPDPPIIGHNATYTVTPEYGAVAVTITKGTNNVVECTISGTGAAALCVDHTDVTVALA